MRRMTGGPTWEARDRLAVLWVVLTLAVSSAAYWVGSLDGYDNGWRGGYRSGKTDAYTLIGE